MSVNVSVNNGLPLYVSCVTDSERINRGLILYCTTPDYTCRYRIGVTSFHHYMASSQLSHQPSYMKCKLHGGPLPSSHLITSKLCSLDRHVRVS